MQTQMKIHGSNTHYFFADLEVSQRASNGGLVVVRDVKIPMTTTTHQLINNYAIGQVLTLEQKNGAVVDFYYIENDGENYVFSTHP